MMDARKITVIGSGNVGCAISADLTLAGHEVCLYEMPQFKESLVPILKHGGIELLGVARTGFARLSKITTEIEAAIRGAEVIMIATVALAHETIAELCAPYLEDGQTIVLFPGNLGSLVFVKVLKEKAADKHIKIVEAVSAPYGCRRVAGQAEVNVRSFLKLNAAAFPAKDTNRAIDDLKDFYPDAFLPGRNVLEVSLSNPNILLHVGPCILNTGWIEATGGEFAFYRQGMSPSVLRIMEAMWHEKNAIFEVLGLTDHYPFDAIKRMITDPQVQLLQGATDMRHRFITEDCPMGMVSTASLGDMIGVPTPIFKALITLASEINGTDYFKEGRTMERLGISGLSRDELGKFLAEGHPQ